MSTEANGRLVEVKTKFHREASKPGGVSRNGARQASERAIADVGSAVEQQIGQCLVPLIAALRTWPDGPGVQQLCDWAAGVRDMAGLADRHLLTEVAMYTYDSLDAVLVDGAPMERAEAVCYADALAFAQQDLCRGSDFTPYAPLLKDLQRLTTLVAARGKTSRQ